MTDQSRGANEQNQLDIDATLPTYEEAVGTTEYSPNRSRSGSSPVPTAPLQPEIHKFINVYVNPIEQEAEASVSSKISPAASPVRQATTRIRISPIRAVIPRPLPRQQPVEVPAVIDRRKQENDVSFPVIAVGVVIFVIVIIIVLIANKGKFDWGISYDSHRYRSNRY